jgi:hypothetical protein
LDLTSLTLHQEEEESHLNTPEKVSQEALEEDLQEETH